MLIGVPAGERGPDKIVRGKPVVEHGDQLLPVGVALVDGRVPLVAGRTSHPGRRAAASIPFLLRLGLGGSLRPASLPGLGGRWSRFHFRFSLFSFPPLFCFGCNFDFGS